MKGRDFGDFINYEEIDLTLFSHTISRTKIERGIKKSQLLVFKAGAAKPHRSLSQKEGRYPQ